MHFKGSRVRVNCSQSSIFFYFYLIVSQTRDCSPTPPHPRVVHARFFSRVRWKIERLCTVILGDPEAVSGGRKKSKRARRKSGEEKSRTRRKGLGLEMSNKVKFYTTICVLAITTVGPRHYSNSVISNWTLFLNSKSYPLDFPFSHLLSVASNSAEFELVGPNCIYVRY